MRKSVAASLAAALVSPALISPCAALAKEIPSPLQDDPVAMPEDRLAPAPDVAAPPPSEGRGPQPGDPAPPPVSPWGDKLRPDDAAKSQPPPKPRLDEAAGGIAGGLALKVAGTAVAGPVGGFAASMVGSRLGSAGVRVSKRMLGIGKKEPGEQASTETANASPANAVGAGHDAAATAPDEDGPKLGDPAPRPTETAASDHPSS